MERGVKFTLAVLCAGGLSLRGVSIIVLVAQSCPTLAIPWTMEFSRQEYWSRLPFPSPGDLPNPGIEPGSPALQADSLPTELQGKPCFDHRLAVNSLKKNKTL